MWQRGKVSIKNVFLGLRFFFSNESETKKIFSSRSSKMLLLLLRRDGGILEMKLMTSRDLTQKYLYQWPVFDWFLDRGTKMVMIEAQWWCQELHCNWNSNWLLKYFLWRDSSNRWDLYQVFQKVSPSLSLWPSPSRSGGLLSKCSGPLLFIVM